MTSRGASPSNGPKRSRGPCRALSASSSLIVIAGIIAILALGGYALLGIPILNLATSVLAFFGILIAFVGVLVLIAYGLGAPMLPSAIAAEGFDGMEAAHRVASYIFCKPGRFFLYSLVLFLQFIVVASIAAAVALATTQLATWGMGLVFDLTNNADGLAVASGAAAEGRGFSGDWAARIVAFMLKLPALVAAGFMLCYWISGWSVQYLLLRQATDGQDVTDIFVPGEMEERIKRALAARVAGIDANQSGDNEG